MTYVHRIKSRKYAIDDNFDIEINTHHCNDPDATHVITGVTFGSNAYLRFEKATKSHNKNSNVGGM